MKTKNWSMKDILDKHKSGMIKGMVGSTTLYPPNNVNTVMLTIAKEEEEAKKSVGRPNLEKSQQDLHDNGRTYTFKINSMGKPRMTQRDKWLNPPRECVARYWALKEVLTTLAKKEGFIMPHSGYHLTFYLEMPKSWSKSKKETMNNTPHQQKPDKDNLEKFFLDILCPKDEKVWDGRVTKYWSYEGRIDIRVK